MTSRLHDVAQRLAELYEAMPADGRYVLVQVAGDGRAVTTSNATAEVGDHMLSHVLIRLRAEGKWPLTLGEI